MNAAMLLAELHQRGATVVVVGDRLRIEAPKGAVSPALRRTLAAKKPELLRLVSKREPEPDMTGGEVVAVLLKSEVLQGALAWLVADNDALAEHPDIIRSGHAVFFFDEIEQLRGRTPEALRLIAMAKTTLLQGRVLQ